MCLAPNYILTPFLSSRLQEGFTNVTFDGKVVLTLGSSITRKLYNVLCYYRHKVTKDTYKSFQLYNPSTGETQDLYFAAPCGKCVICRSFRANSVIARCSMETCTYGYVPWFITLTYNNKHLPAGVSKRDVQLFFKRLRRNFERYNNPQSFRYLLVSEYGSSNNRPHYHFILWGLPNMDYRTVRSYIRRAWSLEKLDDFGCRIPIKKTTLKYNRKIKYCRESIGFVKVLPMTSGAPQYLVKYMMKGFIHSQQLNLAPCFMLSSIHNGGIGSQFIREKVKPLLFENPTATKFKFVENVVSGKPFTVHVDTFVMSHVLPPASRWFNHKVCECLKRMRLNLPTFINTMFNIEKYHRNRSISPSSYKMFADKLSNYPIISKFLSITKSFFSLPVLGDYGDISHSMQDSLAATLYQHIVSDCTYLLDAFKDHDLSYFDKRRDFFYRRMQDFLSRSHEEYDMQYMAECILRKYRRLIDKETC